jgi:Ca2+-binding EF-hand superfamily protein
LSLRADFNLTDAFRLIDTEQKGFVTQVELQQALKDKLFITASNEDVAEFLKRYDTSRVGKLSQRDFETVFSPFDDFHADLLRRK